MDESVSTLKVRMLNITTLVWRISKQVLVNHHHCSGTPHFAYEYATSLYLIEPWLSTSPATGTILNSFCIRAALTTWALICSTMLSTSKRVSAPKMHRCFRIQVQPLLSLAYRASNGVKRSKTFWKYPPISGSLILHLMWIYRITDNPCNPKPFTR